MKKSLCSLVVALALGSSVVRGQLSEGIANEPCGKLDEILAEPAKKTELTAWIQGFITAVNAVSVRTEDVLEGVGEVLKVQHKDRELDSVVLMGEVLKRVKQVCEQNPNLAEGKDRPTSLFHAISAVVSLAVRQALLAKQVSGGLGFVPPQADRFAHGLSSSERDGVLDALEVLEEAQVQRAYGFELTRKEDGALETFDAEFKRGFEFVDKATPKELLGAMRAIAVQRKLTLSRRQKQLYSPTQPESEKDSLLRMLAIAQRNLSYVEALMDHGYYSEGHKYFEEQEQRRKAKKR